MARSRFPAVIGIDVAAGAVERARAESQGVQSTSFRVLDLTAPGSGARLHAEFGDASVFVRGVFHLLPARQREHLGHNLRALVGSSGRVLLTGTNYRGNPLSYLQSL